MAVSVDTTRELQAVTEQAYKYGFVTDIEADTAPKGLSEDIVRFISAKKDEPAWLLDWRLKAYRDWLTMPEPTWANVTFPPIDYQDAYYYSAPKSTDGPKSLDEVDPELLATYEKLGIPLREQEALAGVAETINREFEDVAGLITEEGSGYTVIEEIHTGQEEPEEAEMVKPAKEPEQKQLQLK